MQQALSLLQQDVKLSRLFSRHSKLADQPHSLQDLMEPAGLDLLAAKKREEATRSASNGRGGSSALGKRPRGMLDEEDGDGPSGSGREGPSGQQRQYRTHRLETPSHPGAHYYSTSVPEYAAALPGLQVKAMPAVYMHTAQDKPSLDPTQLVNMMAAEQPAPAQSQYTLQPQLENNSASIVQVA